jgi:hypothetical protein
VHRQAEHGHFVVLLFERRGRRREFPERILRIAGWSDELIVSFPGSWT